MKAITISIAQGIRGDATNKKYSARAAITSLETLIEAVQYDHVAGVFKNNERGNDNFMRADCLMMDCDNDHSDKPADWLSPEKLQERMPGVMFAVIYSKSHMRDKKDRTARPRFHVYYPLSEEITEAGHVARLKEGLLAVVPEFDHNAKDAARFFYGVETPTGSMYEGAKCVDEVIARLEFHTQNGHREHSEESASRAYQAAPLYFSASTAYEGRVISQFLAFMESVGVRPLHALTIIPDGRLHRFATEADSASKKHSQSQAGSYCLHLDGNPAGWVKDYRDRTYNFKYVFDAEERAAYGRQQHNPERRAKSEAERREAARKKEEAKRLQEERRKAAREMALAEWNAGRGNPESYGITSGYLFSRFGASTGIYWPDKGQFSIRYAQYQQEGQTYYDYTQIVYFPMQYCTGTIPGGICKKGELLVPYVNILTGEFQTLQRISDKPDAEGQYLKRFYTGLTPKGAAHALIPEQSENVKNMFVVEGIATALAVMADTGGDYPVYSVGSVENLKPVCEGLKTRYPTKKIILVADNDKAGIEAANACFAAYLVCGIRTPHVQGGDWYDEIISKKGNQV